MTATTPLDHACNFRESNSVSTRDAWSGDVDATIVAELGAFVGPKADYYLGKWAPRLAGAPGGTGINWAAFFLTAVWMGYRKMHRNSLTCICAALGMTLGVEMVFVYLLDFPTTPFSLVILTNLLFCLVCGVRANAWYLSHAQRTIAKAQTRGLAGEQLFEHLGARGGISLLGAFGLVLGPLVAFFLLALGLGLVLFIVGATVR